MSAEVLASLGAIKASSLRIDLSVGKHDSGFTELMRPRRNGSQTSDMINFDMIHQLGVGLQSHKAGSNRPLLCNGACQSADI